MPLRSEEMKKWLLEAYRYARQSPHLTTQNGAVIVSSGGQLIGAGCNTFPMRIQPRSDRLEQANKKNDFLEHAERAAIFDAAYKGNSTQGATMYCPWFACAECARAIISSGIEKVVGYQKCMDRTAERWKRTIEVGFEMFKEAGVTTFLYSDELKSNIEIRFDGATWIP